MKTLTTVKLFALMLLATAFNTAKAQCTDLFISEYVEGSGSNKAIEIYNSSTQAINLSNYALLRFTNGSTTPSGFGFSMAGTLLPDSTYVIVNNLADSLLLTKADTLTSYLSFNGDDALALVNLVTFDTVDIFGVIGQDPGSAWTGGGISTQNETLKRKYTIQQGVGVNPTTFDPSVEWDALGNNNFSDLGTHTSSCHIPCTNDTTNVNNAICQGDSVLFNGMYLSNSGTYFDTLQNAGGCDSLIVYNLTVNPLPNIQANATATAICTGDSTLLFGQGGVVYVWSNNVNDSSYVSPATTTTYLLLGEDANGCLNEDSITITVQNTVTPTVTITTADSILCEGEGTSFSVTIVNGGMSPTIQWKRNGNNVGTGLNTYTSLANFTNNGDVITCEVTSSSSCGTTAVSNAITITVLQPDSVSVSETLCAGDSLIFGNQTLTNAGTYTETFTNINGCDSIVTLNLSIDSAMVTTINDTICANTPYQFAGQSLTQTGVYYDSLQNANGCDSIIELNLVVLPSQTTNLTEFICSGDSVVLGGMTYTQSGTYYDTLQNTSGCDSIVTLNLVVGASDTLATQDIICGGDSIIFGTQVLTQPGVYVETFTSTGGCDSIVALTLEVVPVTYSTVYDTICANDSVVFGGMLITQTGTYHDTILNAGGCDSIMEYNVVVLSVDSSVITQTICLGDSIMFGGQYYNQSGVYTSVFQNANGCDSIVLLELMLELPTDTLINEAICNGNSISFGTQTITQAGTYTEVFQSINGCDSTVTMVVTVGTASDTSLVVEICDGEFYNFGSQVLTSTGTYTEVFSNATGCDSTVVLTLVVKANPIVSISVVNGDLVATQGDSYQWLLNGDTIPGATNQTYTPTENGIYTVIMTAFNGCSGTNNYTMQNVSVSEFEGGIIGVSPNPSAGIFVLSSSKNTTYELYNMLGELVLRSTLNTTQHTIDISDRETGVYILKVSSSNGQAVIKRLIKQ